MALSALSAISNEPMGHVPSGLLTESVDESIPHYDEDAELLAALAAAPEYVRRFSLFHDFIPRN